MDSRISDLPVSADVLASDIIPIASGTSTKRLTVGILAQNLPNFGNKGITKNTVTSASSTLIPLNVTLVLLPTSLVPYTLNNGVAGQEIVLVSSGDNVVNIGSGSVSTLTLIENSVYTLIFTGTKWVVKSSIN